MIRLIPSAAATLDQEEKSVTGTTRVLTNGDVLFTITGGPIQIESLQSVCIGACDVTAATLQYQSAPTVGSAKTISNPTASLASMTAGSTITLNQTSLATAPDIVTAANGGVAIGANVANQMIVQAGTIKAVVGTGPTTGTFKHYLRYRPLAPGVVVTGS